MKKICLIIGGLLMASVLEAQAVDLSSAPGAEIMKPNIENGQIDSMSGIVYAASKTL